MQQFVVYGGARCPVAGVGIHLNQPTSVDIKEALDGKLTFNRKRTATRLTSRKSENLVKNHKAQLSELPQR